MLKVDFERELRALYSPGRSPAIVDVPEMAFLMIDGQGDPVVSAEYHEAIEALYSVTCTAKFAVKHSPDGVDFTVMPLESLSDPFLDADRSAWRWTAMIMQPDAVDEEVAHAAMEAAGREEAAAARRADALRALPRGARGTGHARGSVLGGGADHRVALHEFIAAQGCEPSGRHHEIYLGDPRRTAPAKLKTVIRQPVA
jgi:hypothetical protein